MLTDADDYPAWNPMIAGLKGQLKKGAVTETIEGHGADRRVFRPTVLIADRNRELRWRGHLWSVPGLFVVEHSFLLHPMTHGTIFAPGESISTARCSGCSTRRCWCRPAGGPPGAVRRSVPRTTPLEPDLNEWILKAPP